MDLGSKRDNEPTVAAPQDAPEVCYPGFSLNEKEKIKEFLEEHPVTMGDVITFKGTAKVTGMSDQRYGTSLSFDLLRMDHCEVKGDEEEEEEHKGSVFHNPAMRHMMGKHDEGY